ncbi:hypothetical protein [Streptomyces niveus]|uniref:hypothetical protein n=1 Tax=Streptomyces niveus TaxID=193462 RepID=UPI0036A38318
MFQVAAGEGVDERGVDTVRFADVEHLPHADGLFRLVPHRPGGDPHRSRVVVPLDDRVPAAAEVGGAAEGPAAELGDTERLATRHPRAQRVGERVGVGGVAIAGVRGDDVPDEVLTEIVDEVFPPPVRGRATGR